MADPQKIKSNKMWQEQDNNKREDCKPPERIADLIAGHLGQTLNKEEQNELNAWLAGDENKRLFDELTNPKVLKEGIVTIYGIDEKKMLKKIMSHIKE